MVTERVLPGRDLIEEIKRIVIKNNIEAGVILSGVGSLTKAKIRAPLIDGVIKHLGLRDLEIVSLNGTVSKSGNHIHISVSDIEGKVWGGHLKKGAIVRTTCELVIGIVPETKFTREIDDQTGYEELEVHNKQ